MKKLLIGLLLLCGISEQIYAASCAEICDPELCGNTCTICSHTTFVPRMMSQNLVLEDGLFFYNQFNLPCCDSECPPWVSLQVAAPYYFKSTNGAQLGRYFMPGCQECATVGQNNTSDISSLWLKIAAPADTPFESTICIEPKRSVIGGAIRLFFDFGAYDSCYCNWWASIFVPVQQVRHDLNIVESSSPTSGTPTVPPSFPNVISALNNPEWQYGKFSTNRLKKTGVDDISLRVGYNFVRDEENLIGAYGLLFIPTGRGTKAEYVFEPLVGSKHVGLGFGFIGDYTLYECGATSVDLMFDARYARFFKHHETRSIDLYNDDWSRYLLVAQPADAVTPLSGINFFTQEVDVNPRNMLEVWAALSFNYCSFHFEAGYDFWYRSKEKISLADQDLGVGIFDIAYNPNNTCQISASCARICQSVPTLPGAPESDLEFVTVKNSNTINDMYVTEGNNCANIPCSYLNLNSAAHPRALSSTVYGAISYDCCLCCEYPVMIGVGGQYEFAHRRSALSQYGVWLKTAISF